MLDGHDSDQRDRVDWRKMPVLHLLVGLGIAAAVVVSIAYVLSSAVSGWGFVMAPIVAWLAFAVVVGLGAPLTILVMVSAQLLLLPFGGEKHQDKAFLVLRWIAFVGGVGALLIIGGGEAVNGWQHNRFKSVAEHQAQCMAPRTRNLTTSYQTCRDGWTSSTIGSRGACSHHGGVVKRERTRNERFRLHNAAWCARDARARSWLD